MAIANAQAKEKKTKTKTELNLAQTVSLLIMLICGFMVLVSLFASVFIAIKGMF